MATCAGISFSKKQKNKNEEAAYNRIADNDAGATSCTEGGY